ncbi:30S ribosomal protein S6 [bacterium]|nr:30S ribosomal protein S6 [bacterium]
MLVKKEQPVREYELTYLVGSAYTTAEMNSLQDSIVTLIGKNGCEIVDTQDWGKKTLAYKIKKDGKAHSEAVYTHLVIKMAANKVQALARAVELKREVLRSLLVVRTSDDSEKAETEEKKGE